ncbi:hypothetical protein [Paraflavitalea speifideaquila]|nr:hypothetical protein [Paraflavitalea speifideiaquila]
MLEAVADQVALLLQDKEYQIDKKGRYAISYHQILASWYVRENRAVR